MTALSTGLQYGLLVFLLSMVSIVGHAEYRKRFNPKSDDKKVQVVVPVGIAIVSAVIGALMGGAGCSQAIITAPVDF